MKNLTEYLSVFLIIFSFGFYSHNAVSDPFPITVDVEVTMLDVWPSSPDYRFTARTSAPLDQAGCQFRRGFAIKEGPGAEAAYSTLLAAVMASKTVQIYIVSCDYMAVADRIRLLR